MADAYTNAAAVADVIKAAYEQRAFYALRPQLHFDQIASVRATRETQPGSSVVFTFWNDLNEATTVLNEVTDPDAVALGDTTVTVTLAEYGNVMKSTAKARITSFLDIDEAMANTLGFNAGVSIDTLARDALSLGTNVVYATGGSSTPTARLEVQTDDIIAATDVRKVLAQLRTANVMPMSGNYYFGAIHPDVSIDLREETGAAAWRDPHTYAAQDAIWAAELGAFEGVRWLETPRAKVWTDGGSGSRDVYATHILGAEALAKGVSMGGEYGEQPQIVVGPQTDALRRLHTLGWKHFVGYKVFREAAVRRIESSSSIGS